MNTFDVSKDYNRDKYVDFLNDFLPDDFELNIEEVFYKNYTNIDKVFKLGTVPSLNLDVFEFRTIKNRDPRVTLTKEAVSFMKNVTFNPNALVVFYSNSSHNWRLSLITTDYEIINDKVKSVYSNPRRFSFRLGAECKAHTPTKMLFYKGQVEDKEDLKSRFALEVVSKEFFDEYKVFYEDFVQFITGNRYVKTTGNKYEKKEIHKPNSSIFSQFLKLANNDEEIASKLVRNYIKKFMGRLVFLHFLQRKGWLGVENGNAWGSGDKNFMYNLFSNSKYKADFLDKVLEPLFFGMLNTSEDSREKLFKRENWNLGLLKDFKRIPYLNGGLFEDDDLDRFDIKFPKELFSNPAMKDVTRTFNFKGINQEPYFYSNSCGLLDFFNRYNFTIDETDPADMEIGVEPEMLGKIFENLLEDNKDKGAFYTPKEIVQYMCRESLIAYLLTDSKIEENRIRELVLTHKGLFTDAETEALLKKMREVKICDPAVGSGAFPMGLLNELFACRVALGEKASAADIKKDIVRENIYGVDIEKGAVDIARLRFWLAIIVDEKEPIPLPNLDYKIMQGNSLLESFENEDLSNLTTIHEYEYGQGDLFGGSAETIERLKRAIDDYYVPADYIAKRKLRAQISERVIQLLKERNLQPHAVKKLESIDLHSNSEFFLWHTWFNDVFNRKDGNSGFDIVIGNPPYIQLQKDKGKLAEIYENKGYKSFTRMGDIYCLFYENGYNLLRGKGLLCFITSNKWMRAGYGEKLRDFFAKNVNPKILIDFAGVKVFENATVDTNILLFERGENKGKTLSCMTTNLSKDDMANLNNYFLNNSAEYNFNTHESWVILSPIEQAIKQKIESKGIPLQDWDISINYGIKTGLTKAFIIDGEKRDEILANCKDEEERQKTAELIRPILRGRDIKQYSYNWNNQWLIYIPWHFPLQFDQSIQGASEKAEKEFKKQYPAVYSHMLQFEQELWARNKSETGIRYEWYAMQRWGANYWDEFDKPRIVYCEIGTSMDACLIEPGIFVNNKLYMVSGNYLEFLLLFFNSRLFNKIILRATNLTGGKGEEFMNKVKCIIPDEKTNLKAIELVKNNAPEKEKEEFINNIFNLSEEQCKYLE